MKEEKAKPLLVVNPVALSAQGKYFKFQVMFNKWYLYGAK